MTVIKINSQALIDKLAQAAQHMTDTTLLTAAIAQSLDTVTQDNFDAGGRPTWMGRKAVTIESYERQGLKYGGVLQLSGTLRSRIVTGFSRDEAMIGTNVPYAAIHQFGGKAGRGRKVDIPARPFLPMDKNGNLQHEASLEIERDVHHFWQKIFD